MTNRRIPTGCAVALLMIQLASSLSAASFKCGDGVSCDWILDIPTRGAFVLSHPGKVNVTEDPLKGQPHSFVSPSGFWTVVFDSFNQYDGPDGLIGGADEVDVTGYMQHLKRPPGPEHADDPDLGDKFPFDLSIIEWVSPEDTASAQEKHGGHTDTYLALLAGTDAKAPKTGMLSYNFGVKGQHTEILFTPLTGTPEPSTCLLVGAALLLPFLKKVRQFACPDR
jgi:hypothetical protein